MRGRRVTIGAVLLAGLVAIAAACGGGGGGSKSQGAGGNATTSGTSGAVQKGGTYRTELVDFGFTGGFDPTAEYLGLGQDYMANLLVRTLVNFRHTAGAAGNEVVPDLATALPKISADGLTYTFTLKQGLKFGPPVNRAITTKDIAYAFQRIATKSVVAQYPSYYLPVIKGMQDYFDGKAKSISGIETPDARTIVFHLTQKTGDFVDRLTFPATGPIPQEVAKCFTGANEYGRYVISSGPYMIKGSPSLNISSCGSMKPISGFDPNSHLTFVRNPNWDRSTDSYREANVDSVAVTVNTNEKDSFDKIRAGQLDGDPDNPTPDILRPYVTTASLKDRIKAEQGDRTWYIFMNMTTPPFDDVHVRKAANWVMNKAGLQRAWGGGTQGDIATHIAPGTMYEGGQFAPADYDPYKSQDEAGDVQKAKDEMKQSKYDTNKDGVCDASACKNLFFVNRNYGPFKAMEPVIEQSLGKIGITLNPRDLPTSAAYTTTQTVAKKVPIAANASWGKDYADLFTFANPILSSNAIQASGNNNFALVGLTQKQAGQLGLKYPAGGVPSIDADIAKCEPLAGSARNDCWIALDKRLTEDIVPWVPYLFAKNVDIVSDAVTKYAFDQNYGETAYANVAVDPTKQ